MYKEKLHDLHTLPVVRKIKLRKAKWTVHMSCTGDVKNCNFISET
jgi:hypothetical protein